MGLCKIFTARLAKSLWASIKPIVFTSLFENPGFGLDPSSDGPDDPAERPEPLDIQYGLLDFFIFMSI